MTAEPPLIPPSTCFQTDYTGVLSVGTVLSTLFTVGSGDGTLTLSSGHLYGLADPVNPSDAVRKSYADSVISSAGSVLVSTPINSVQYNSRGLLKGSPDLLYYGSDGILYSTVTNVGTNGVYLGLGGGTVWGLVAPTVPDQAMNRQYVDDLYTTGTTLVLSTAGVTYGTMASWIIYRNPGGVNVTDTTPDGATISTRLAAALVTSAWSSIKNVWTEGTVTVSGGAGVTMIPTGGSFGLEPGYEMRSLLVPTAPTTVAMYVTGLSYCGAAGLVTAAAGDTAEVTVVGGSLTRTAPISTITVQNYTYGPKDLSTINYRGYNGTTMADTLYNAAVFSTGYAFADSPVNYLGSPTNPTGGAVEFVVKNVSTTATLTLSAPSSTGWVVQDGAVTIPSGGTGYFYAQLTGPTSGALYTIGIS